MYMYKQDLALNNLQMLMCHKTQPINLLFFYKDSFGIKQSMKVDMPLKQKSWYIVII